MNKKFGCHCDLENGQVPDSCVLDTGKPEDCVQTTPTFHPAQTKKVTKKEECPHWREYNEQQFYTYTAAEIGITQQQMRKLNCMSFEDFHKMLKEVLENPNVHKGYVEEKFEQNKQGLFLMALDLDNFYKLVQYLKDGTWKPHK